MSLPVAFADALKHVTPRGTPTGETEPWHVAVFGTDTSNTITATKVGIGNRPAGGRGGPGGSGAWGGGTGGTPPAAFGTVKSVGPNTFTVTKEANTTATVNVGGATTYIDPG